MGTAASRAGSSPGEQRMKEPLPGNKHNELFKDPERKAEHFILTCGKSSRVPDRSVFQKFPFKSRETLFI